MESQPKTTQGSWLPLLKLLGAVLLGWLVFTSVYFGKPIKGWVVDAETGQPIEGAVVVVLYDLRGPRNLLQYGTVGHLHLTEAVTDANGRYRIPFWGPRLGIWGGIDRGEPSVIAFKDGYEPFVIANRRGEIGGDPSEKRWFLIGSVWNGERLSLQPYRGPNENYSELAADPLSLIKYTEDCRWERLPRYFAALMRIRNRPPREERYFAGPTVETLYQDGACQHPTKLLKPYETN